MTQPFVGLPTTGTGCAFAADLDSPKCGSEPSVHLIVQSAAWGMVTLESCDRHAAIARLAGDEITEHAYGPDCPGNRCLAINRG